MNSEAFRQLSLSFPEATEQPHFERNSFRVRKKIFATFDAKSRQVTLKLNEVDQSVFSAYNTEIIHPVPNKWGKQGWTIFHITQLPDEMMQDALTCAFKQVAPKTLAAQV